MTYKDDREPWQVETVMSTCGATENWNLELGVLTFESLRRQNRGNLRTVCGPSDLRKIENGKIPPNLEKVTNQYAQASEEEMEKEYQLG